MGFVWTERQYMECMAFEVEKSSEAHGSAKECGV